MQYGVLEKGNGLSWEDDDLVSMLSMSPYTFRVPTIIFIGMVIRVLKKGKFYKNSSRKELSEAFAQ